VEPSSPSPAGEGEQNPYYFLVPLSCGSYRVHTSLTVYVSGFRSPPAPLVKGGESIKFSSSPFTRGIEGDL